MTTHSSVAVVVISKGRPAILKETLEGFLLQTKKASQVIVVVTSAEDLPPKDVPGFVELYISKPGICAQRNHGLEKIAPGTDYVAFFDDDMELKPDYLEKAVDLLDNCPSIAAFSGWIIRDGGIDRQEAKQVIANYQRRETYAGAFLRDAKYTALYGCCMFMRMSLMHHEKFDENLPLYCFGEDYDMSMRLRRYGFVGKFDHCIGIHLRTPGGRVNEVQRGYSIVANNWYFIRKGVSHLPPFPALVRFWIAIVLKLWVLALWRAAKGDKTSDWLGRARGFVIGALDIMRGRSSPQRMLDFSK